MTTPHEASLMTRIYERVVAHGRINRYDLEDEVRISMFTMDKIKPKLLRRYRVGNTAPGKPILNYDSKEKEFFITEVQNET